MMSGTPPVRAGRLQILRDSDIIQQSDEHLQKLYMWIDEIPLSRTKKNLNRDFSDGVMAAEVVRFYLPNIVDIHNYTAANGTRQKENNWYLLCRKVLSKLQLDLSGDVIKGITQCKLGYIESFLFILRRKIDYALADTGSTITSSHGAPDDVPQWMGSGSPYGTDHEKPEADQRRYSREEAWPQEYQPSESGTERDVFNQSNFSRQSGLQMKRDHVKGKTKQEMVPKSLLLQKENEISQKAETVEILNIKVQRLEHLLHLKDIRIDDLTGQLEALNAQLDSSKQVNTRGVRVSMRGAPSTERGDEGTRGPAQGHGGRPIRAYGKNQPKLGYR